MSYQPKKDVETMRERKEIEARLVQTQEAFCAIFGRGMDCEQEILNAAITELEWVLDNNLSKYDRL